jgi:hypothetical protein
MVRQWNVITNAKTCGTKYLEGSPKYIFVYVEADVLLAVVVIHASGIIEVMPEN